MNFIMIAVLVLGAIALIAALVLFVVSKKFAVDEDPRLGQVGEILPGANCGGCGFAGCSGMAAALVKGADAGSIEGLMCPVGGADVMGKVADLLGIAVANTDPKVAVVRCNGSCEHRPRIAEYDGLCLFSLLQVSRLLRQRIHPLPGLQIRMIYHFKIFSSEIGYIYHNRCFWRCGALVSIYRSSGSRRFSGYLTRRVSFCQRFRNRLF